MQAVHAFLLDSGCPETAKLFLEEAGFDVNTAIPSYSLERRWNSVIRLQQKVLDLETELKLYKAKAHFPSTNQLCLPEPARQQFTASERAVNCIAFHPFYSYMAVGGDDCRIRLYDFELQQTMETLSGHISAVNKLLFTADGLFLSMVLLNSFGF
jgi:WD40 repeat protein